MRRSTLLIGVIAGLLLSLGLARTGSAAPAFRALVFSKTAGYRHDSIAAGITMFQQQAAANNFELVHSEDSSVFTTGQPRHLRRAHHVPDLRHGVDHGAQRQAVEGYLASGKGIVAIHNATDMGIEGEYPWWDQTVNAGAHMPEHSPGVAAGHRHRRRQEAPVDGRPAGPLEPQRGVVQLRPQPARRRARPGHRRRAHLQPGLPGDGPGPPDLLVPRRRRRPGLGHRAWATPSRPTARRTSATTSSAASSGRPATMPGDCGGTVWGNFEKRTLDDNTVDPMALAVAPDGRVFYVQRGGQLKIFKPSTQQHGHRRHAQRLHRRRGRPHRAWRWTRTSPPTDTSTCTTRRPAARPTSTGSPASPSAATR